MAGFSKSPYSRTSSKLGLCILHFIFRGIVLIQFFEDSSSSLLEAKTVLCNKYDFSTLKCLIPATWWYIWTKIGTEILNMSWDVINQDRLWTNDSNDMSYTKSCVTALWGFHVHTISHFVLYAAFLGLWRHCIYSFKVNFVCVNPIGRCGEWRRVILRGDVIPNMASTMEQLFLATILFTLLWHCSAIPLPSGTWAYLNLRRAPTSMKAQNSLLQNAVALSMSIFAFIKNGLQLMDDAEQILLS